MAVDPEKLVQVKLRIKLKKFRDSIPIGLGLKMPDELCDSLSEEEDKIFLKTCEELKLKSFHTPQGVYWEVEHY